MLFQYRVMSDGKPNAMRTCEERIFVLRARSATEALLKAKRRGKRAEFRNKSASGSPVFFEFVGLQDLLELGPECDDDEVWYDIRVLKRPMERVHRLLPPEARLNAILWEHRQVGRPRR